MNIFGKYIDDNQQVLKSLTKIYGIGRPTAKELCMTFGIGLDRKVKDLSKDTWSILIKAAELGPHKYKDLVKELQETGLALGSTSPSANVNLTGSISTDYGYFSVTKSTKSESKDPLIETISQFIGVPSAWQRRSLPEGKKVEHAKNLHLTGSFVADSRPSSALTSLGSVLINGKLRSQKVEVRALTDLREGLEAEKKMKSYRGLRHLEGLPVRGQRTSTNALTARKRRK